jgi:hypothetical protein
MKLLILPPFLTPQWEVAAIASKFEAHGYDPVGKCLSFPGSCWFVTTKPTF